jgi:hypothetical protein
VSRVTRLGEFSAITFFKYLGKFVKYKQLPQFWRQFFTEKVTLLNFAKYVFGFILGDFFTTASGHPGREHDHLLCKLRQR